MKIIITESQGYLLWLMRRIEDDEYLDYIWLLIREGFDYTDACDYDSYSDYLKEVLDGSVTTFINSYPQLYKVWDGGGDYDEMFEFIYDFMLNKFNDKIRANYVSDREICDELEDEENQLN
jgi:hypothetical protein